MDCTRLTDDSGSSPFPLVNNPRGSERRPNSPERHVKSRDFITGHSDTLAAVSTIWKSLTKIMISASQSGDISLLISSLLSIATDGSFEQSPNYCPCSV